MSDSTEVGRGANMSFYLRKDVHIMTSELVKADILGGSDRRTDE